MVSPGFAPVDQYYLFQARQLQALSFAVHIPLVCSGIAFPAMVLFGEWRYLRTGDPLYHALALPVVIAGITGSRFVISVNGWMNHEEEPDERIDVQRALGAGSDRSGGSPNHPLEDLHG